MRTLGFTRPAHKIAESVAQAERMGFSVLAAPSLDILPGDPQEFERLAQCIFEGAPIVFGSSTAADACSKQFGGDFDDMLAGCDVIAIGPGTAERLREYDVRADIIPGDHSSYGLLDAIRSRYSGGRIALVRSDSGSNVLSDGLRESGFEPVDIAAYRLRAATIGPEMIAIMDAIAEKKLDWIAFTSSMSASSFISAMETRFGELQTRMMNERVNVAAIGGPTADRLCRMGREPDLVPRETTFTALLEAIRGTYRICLSDTIRPAAYGPFPVGF